MRLSQSFGRKLAYSVTVGTLAGAMLACSLQPGWVPGAVPPTVTVSGLGSTTGSARTIQSGESATGRLAAHSAEAFIVKVTAGQALRLELDVDGDPANVTVGVADSTGKAVTTQASVSGKRLTVVTDPLSEGDYTITLTNVSSDETPYTLAVTTGDPAVVGVLPPGTTPLAPVATVVASADATATPVSSGPVGPYVGQTACDHPYFPMRPGSTWTYNFVSPEFSGTYTMVVDSVTGDAETAEAKMTMTFDVLVFNYTWTCTRTGGIQSYDYAMGGGSGAGMSVANVTGEGYFLLSADQLLTNASWTYSSAGDISMEVAGTTMTGSNSMSATNTVAGVGGTYDYQGTTLSDVVVILSEQTSSVTMSGATLPAAETTSTLQFARGIGLVSSATAGSDVSSSSTLASYTIP